MAEVKRLYMVRDGIVRETIYDDDVPDRIVVHTTQDIEEILDGIARDRETMRHGTNKKLATLPAFVVEDLINRGIQSGRLRRPGLTRASASWRV
jgi:hypothetical protein